MLRAELLAELKCNQKQPVANADAKSGISAKYLRSWYKRGAQQLLRLFFSLLQWMRFVWWRVGFVAFLAAVVFSVSVLASVCSDSNYNLSATHSKRRTSKAVAANARLIDEEHSSYSIIYLFGKK